MIKTVRRKSGMAKTGGQGPHHQTAHPQAVNQDDRLAALHVLNHSLLHMRGRPDASAGPSLAGCVAERAAYFAASNASVMSSMRLEKPHSLSYQASTLTKVPPVTLVRVLS